MIKIHRINLNDVAAEQLNEWFEQMSDEKKRSVSATKIKHKCNLRIVADGICRLAIAEFCAVSPAEIELGYNEHGKPFAKNLPVHFSISHSDDIAVCAVSDKEIGIDIEKIRDVNPRSAERFASEKEQEYIRKCEKGFFEIWTLKEAYFKCIGTGLGADIKNVTFDISEEGVACSESGYKLSFIQIETDYVCSVCEKMI